MNPKEWKILTTEPTKLAYNYEGKYELGEHIFGTVIVSIAMAIPVVGFSFLLAPISPFLVIPLVLLGLVSAYKIPTLNKYHVMHGVHWNARNHAKFYYECSAEERLRYPTQTVEVLKDHKVWDRWQPSQDASDAFNRIENEIERRRLAMENKVDLDSFKEEADRAVEDMKIENDTYEEFM